MSMEVGKLTVTTRSTSGKGPARQLRAKGQVPGVCYGASKAGRLEPLPIIVDVKALRAALDPVRKQNTVIELTVDDGGKKTVLSALLRDYQVDAIRRDITHVDLMAIDPDKEVVAVVPLEFAGKPKGVIDGGQIRTVLRDVSVRAKPADIPVKLIVDVSPLGVGDVVHVSDIPVPAGVTYVTGRDQAVAMCALPEEDKTPVAAATDATAAAGAAPAAGAAAPAAGGKAPAAAAGGKAPAGGKAAPAAAGGKAAPAAPAAKGGGKK
ncbi:MAG: 50S ribosomal protein L25 [Kofleriaceae bacterium]|jgi:large subunit ribosomal protein L25|nr:50S ribosomal protein L25 [Kofleriaceae bacterium]MBP6838130.1 50S ribosomal protein L25 [Kofleriaceae bacterium]MBP9206324.1 50S ribosomal protein L25 [Kofleriaceae bacterium]